MAKRNYLPFEDCSHGCGHIAPGAHVQGNVAGQKTVGGHADGINVRSWPDIAKISNLFGWHVSEGSGHVTGHSDSAHAGLCKAFRQAKISEFGDEIRGCSGYQNIGFLDVAVDITFRVRVSQSIERLRDDLNAFAQR